MALREPKRDQKNEFVQGSFDMLILKALSAGPMHGYAVARRIHETSREFLKVEEGASGTKSG